MCTISRFVFKIIVAFFFVILGNPCIYGQNNALVLNGGFINIKNGTWANPIYLVVNKGTTAAIQRNSGHIISEQEGNFVNWITNDVTSAATYVFPFGYSNTDYLPVTVYKGSVGVGAGHVDNSSPIIISTWGTPANNTTWANAVAGMTGLAGANETNSVIDRWWQIITNNNVTATGDFTYRGAENTTLFPTGPFVGQQWDIPLQEWVVPGTGTGPGVTTGTATVAGITLTPNGLATTTPYILSATISPLPIELISFTASCENLKTHIRWTDATETNVMNIELQKSLDLNNWTTIYTAMPSNTSTNANYDYLYSETNTGGVYYRLKTNDNDGSSDVSAIVSNPPCNSAGNSISAFYYNNALNLFSHFEAEEDVIYTLYDVQGRQIIAGQYTANKGETMTTIPIAELANDIYILNAYSITTNYNQKIAIAR